MSMSALTHEEQDSLDMIQEMFDERTVGLMRVRHDGKERAVLFAASQMPDGMIQVAPLALLVDADLMAEMDPEMEDVA